MPAVPQCKISPEEYLAAERAAEFRSEYFNGEVLAMAGNSPEHVQIEANVIGELRNALKGRPCRVFTSNLRVRVSATGLYTYPDASALCGEARFADDQRDTLLNPALIVEILSRSTEADDRGRKFLNYQTIPSLMEYVLISQEEPRIEKFTRQTDGQWLWSCESHLESVIRLESVGCALALREIYYLVFGETAGG